MSKKIKQHKASAVMTHRDTKGPYVEMYEQPLPHSIRFRYASEGNSHGGLQGISSQRGRKTYPTIVIYNCLGPVRIVVELIAKDCKNGIKPHAHELIGKNCRNGVYSAIHNVDSRACQIDFKHLSVQHVTKKSLLLTLQKRLLRQNNHFLEDYEPTDAELKSVADAAGELMKDLAMNSARLCFHVYLLNEVNVSVRALEPAVSDAIFDAKSPSAALLKICRIDRHAGSCQGGDEIFMLCDRVQKGDIEVLFYEINDDNIVWEDYGKFNESDIHRQFAIVFSTPPYRDQTIAEPVTVYIQLKRPSDSEQSDPVRFTYHPNVEMDDLKRKRMKTIHLDFSTACHETRSTSRGSSKSAQSVLGLDSSFFNGNERGNSGSGRLASPSLTVTDARAELAPGSGDDAHDTVTDATSEHLDTSSSTATVVVSSASDAGTRLATPLASDASGGPVGSASELITALELYAITGNTRTLLYHLTDYLNTPNNEGDSPLGVGVIHGRTEAVVNMIEVSSARGLDCLQHRNNLGQTVLHLCVINKKMALLTYLLGPRLEGSVLTSFRLPLSAQDHNRNTVLHTIVRYGDVVALQALASHVGALRQRRSSYDDRWLNYLNNDGFSALHVAVRAGANQCLSLLYEIGVDVNVQDGRSGMTALHHAVLADDLATVASLLSQSRLLVDSTCSRGQTALHYACWQQNIAMATLMMTREPSTSLLAPNLEIVEDERDDVDVEESGDDDVEEPGDDDDDEADVVEDKPHVVKDEPVVVKTVSCVSIATSKGNFELLRVLQGRDSGDLTKTPNDDVNFANEPASGDLWRLGRALRMRVSALMDSSGGDDWRQLAEKLNMASLIPYLRNVRDPVLAILDNYEILDGSVSALNKAVLDMRKYDVAHLLHVNKLSS